VLHRIVRGRERGVGGRKGMARVGWGRGH
jgi:hypothetical protein